MRRFLLAALAATGCLTPPDDDVLQFVEDFEACDDLCGWSAAGDVRRVTTYHPGEHAMSLAPHATATHAIALARDVEPDWNGGNQTDGNWLELSTDCSGPGSLTVTRTGGDATRNEYALHLVLDDRGVGPFTRHRLNFPPIDPALPATFTTLHLGTRTLGCVVDNLQARISGGL